MIAHQCIFLGRVAYSDLLHWTDIPVQTSPHCSMSLCYMIGHSTYHYWHSQQRKLNGRLKSCAASGETSRQIRFSSWKDLEHAAFAFQNWRGLICFAAFLCYLNLFQRDKNQTITRYLPSFSPSSRPSWICMLCGGRVSVVFVGREAPFINLSRNCLLSHWQSNDIMENTLSGAGATAQQ